jgi:hypothetical protein
MLYFYKSSEELEQDIASYGLRYVRESSRSELSSDHEQFIIEDYLTEEGDVITVSYPLLQKAELLPSQGSH